MHCCLSQSFYLSGCSGSPPMTAPLSANVGLRASLMSEIRLVLDPVKDTFANDVVEAHRHKAQVDKHLPETEPAGTGDLRQLAVDDRPGHHEDRFHVEQNEEHGYKVKAHAQPSPGVSDGLDAAFVSVQLDDSITVPADEPGCRDHPEPKQKRSRDLHQQR